MSQVTPDEPITIPTESELTAWIDGAWERKGRRIGGGAFDEPAAVLWLNVAPYFCDFRVLERNDRHPSALDLSQAFSGRATVTENILSWTHDLDTEKRVGEHADSAPMIGHRGELLEIGTDYEERWVRACAPGGPAGVGEIADRTGSLFARMVLVGNAAIAVWTGSMPGGALVERGDRWKVSHTVGAECSELDLVGVALELGGGAPLPRGWRRVV
jgi:hypothetical protein